MWGTNQTSRRVLAATITAGALLLTGCTTGEPDDDITAPSFAPVSPEPSEFGEPDAAPSTSEPSTEPTLAAPPLPPEAAEQTPEGAVAFTEWWFDTLNYATETGNTDALRAASDPDCQFCEQLAVQIEDAEAVGGRVEGGLATVEINPPGGLQDMGINLAIFVDLEATRVVDSDGVTLEEFPASEAEAFVASVLLVSDGWQMGEVSS